ncbi:hypothetical protein DRF62_06670 [Chryseobacterium piscium]|uniref:Uncharacterized protein n=1 Tax=Chryseobacterium piscium TaxID=333702 RepID=A0A3D9BPL7_9FLAO|nr:hypothetical protein DRF62_06670 [Chryseobacterium piscium]
MFKLAYSGFRNFKSYVCLNFYKYYFVGKRKDASFLSFLIFKAQNTSTSLSVTKKLQKKSKNKTVKILS